MARKERTARKIWRVKYLLKARNKMRGWRGDKGKDSDNR